MPEIVSHAKCVKCNQIKESTFFPKNKKKSNGLQSYCYVCMRAARKKSDFTERGIARRKAYMQRTDISLKFRTYRTKYSRSEKGKAEARNMYKKYSYKFKARRAVSDALKRGDISKPKCCTNCGSTEKISAHHYLGYDQEHYLDIQWLCRKCHNIAHIKEACKGSGPSNFQRERLHS